MSVDKDKTEGLARLTADIAAAETRLASLSADLVERIERSGDTAELQAAISGCVANLDWMKTVRVELLEAEKTAS